MPVRLSSTLDELLAYHTATLSPMSVEKNHERLKPLEEKGRAEALKFEFWSSNINALSYYHISLSLFCIVLFSPFVVL
jgi:hypothetical protein